ANHLTTEQMRIARITPPRLASEARDKRPILAATQPCQRSLNFRHVRERRHTGRATAQLSRSLRPAHQQLTDDRELLGVEFQGAELGVAKPMLVLRHPAAES